jgi:hypothetical protein
LNSVVAGGENVISISPAVFRTAPVPPSMAPRSDLGNGGTEKHRAAHQGAVGQDERGEALVGPQIARTDADQGAMAGVMTDRLSFAVH